MANTRLIEFPGPHWRPLLSAAAVVATLGLLPVNAAGQQLRMRIVDASTGEGIAAAVATVTASGFERRDTTDLRGAVLIELGTEGSYRLRVEHPGYQTLDSLAVRVGKHEVVELTVSMSQAAVRLDPITVTARRIAPEELASLAGLYARRAQAVPVGAVRVVVRDDPQMRSAMSVADVLKWFVLARRGCTEYIVDGIPWPGLNMEDLSVERIEGIEFYQYDYEAPAALLKHTGRCPPPRSLVAIWMRPAGG